MDSLTHLGNLIMKAVARSLNLEPEFFLKLYTAQPFTPFRLFHYPADPMVPSDLFLFSLSLAFWSQDSRFILYSFFSL